MSQAETVHFYSCLQKFTITIKYIMNFDTIIKRSVGQCPSTDLYTQFMDRIIDNFLAK